MKYAFNITIFFNFVLVLPALSQKESEIDKWDHWLVLSNKVNVDAGIKLKHTHDFQWRANNNIKSLEQIFYEGALIYSPNRKWDIVPDFRISSKPTEFEYRPGFGLTRKMFWGRDSLHQFNSISHQIKYQADITTKEIRHGVRYILFFNHRVSEKIIIGALGGGFYRWSEEFDGFQFFRFGGSIAFIFNEHNTVSIIEAIGVENNGDYITYAHFPMVQLTVRVKKNYKYKEALIFSF